MKFGFLATLAAAALLAALNPASAGVNCTQKTTEVNGKFGGTPFGAPADTRSLGIGDDDNFARIQAEDCDTDTNTTKNLNGRVTDATALAVAADAVIADPGERINLSLNAVTAQFSSIAFGGSAFVQPDMDLPLRIGVKGAFNPRSGDGVVGLVGTFSFSPF